MKDFKKIPGELKPLTNPPKRKVPLARASTSFKRIASRSFKVEKTVLQQFLLMTLKFHQNITFL